MGHSKYEIHVILNSKNLPTISNFNLTSDFPLALVCRDNELLDVYHLESHSCLKSLKHESKVLNATLHKGIIGKITKNLRNK